MYYNPNFFSVAISEEIEPVTFHVLQEVTAMALATKTWISVCAMEETIIWEAFSTKSPADFESSQN